MKDRIEEIKKEFREKIDLVKNEEEIEKLRVNYLGKKGEFTKVLRNMGKVDPKERPIIGKLVNEAKTEIEESIESFKEKLKSKKREERDRKSVV